MKNQQIKATIKDELLDELNKIKEYFGLNSYSEVLRICIRMSTVTLDFDQMAIRNTATNYPNP